MIVDVNKYVMRGQRYKDKSMSDIDLENRNYRPGEIIFSQGDAGDAAYLVHSGQVEISVGTKNAEVVINVVPAGGLFGEMALIDHSPRMATARAMAKTTCIVVPKVVFEKVMKDSHPVLRAVLSTLMARLRSDGEKTAKGTL